MRMRAFVGSKGLSSVTTASHSLSWILTSKLMASVPLAAPVPPAKPLDHERLTPRESEVLTYLSKGFTIKEIANLMGIKWFTVNDHIKSIYKKLNVSSRAEAVLAAAQRGLI